MARGKKQPGVKLLIDLDSQPALKKLKDFGQRWNKTAIALNQSLEILRKAWGTVTGAIGFAIDTLSDWIALSAEQERQENRVIAALKLRGQFTGESFRALQSFNSQIQQTIGVGDEYLLQLQAQLLATGIQRDRLEEATRATIGLAQVTGQSLTNAARTSSRAIRGEVSALTRYGIAAKDGADATRQLVALYSLAETNANTLATRFRVLDAALGDAGEDLGDVLAKNEDFIAAVDHLAQAVNAAAPVLATLFDWYVSIETAIPKALAWWTKNVTVFRFLREETEDLNAELKKTKERVEEIAQNNVGGTSELARTLNSLGITPNPEIVIPTPEGSRVNPGPGTPLPDTDFVSDGDAFIKQLADAYDKRQRKLAELEQNLHEAKQGLRDFYADRELRKQIEHDERLLRQQEKALAARRAVIETGVNAIAQVAQAQGAAVLSALQTMGEESAKTTLAAIAKNLAIQFALQAHGYGVQATVAGIMSIWFPQKAQEAAAAGAAAAVMAGAAATMAGIAGSAGGFSKPSSGAASAPRPEAFGGPDRATFAPDRPNAPPTRGEPPQENRTNIININKPIGSPLRWKRELEEIMATG